MTGLCVAIAFNNFLIIGDSFDDLGIFLNLIFDLCDGNLLLVEGIGFDLSLGLKSGYNVLVSIRRHVTNVPKYNICDLVSTEGPSMQRELPSSSFCHKEVVHLQMLLASSWHPCHVRSCEAPYREQCARKSFQELENGRDLLMASRCIEIARISSTSTCCGRNYRSC